MGVRNALLRKEKYLKKLDPDLVGKRFLSLKEAMVEEMTVYFNEIFEVETKTKAILSGYDIPITFFPSYLCSARELYRLQKRYAGFPLFREIRILEEKWRSRRLEPIVLKEIRVEVFGILLPEEL